MRDKLARFMRAPLFKDNGTRIMFYVILVLSFLTVVAFWTMLWVPVAP